MHGDSATRARGFWAALGAFLAWGLFPLYWRALDALPAQQIMAHRIVWCFLLVAGFLWATRGFHWWRPLLSQRRLVRLLCASAVLIAANWWLYIWAVNAGHVVETSLGYFINPLVNVLLGVMVLKERLNPRQWLSVAIAAAGVLYLAVEVGRLPWIALGLAGSFALYGLIRKVAVVDSVPALGLESSILFLPSLAYVVACELSGSGGLGHAGFAVDALLVGSGIVTAVPLVLFAYGAQRIPYSMVGLLQYAAPSLQLWCGVWIFGEPFTRAQLAGFGCIWLALAIYAADGLLRLRAAGLAGVQQRQ